MRISELSEVAGFSKSTIHHYVKIGLLPPPSRARTNLYLYDETHLLGLERIRRLKETENLSLEQVKEALERDPMITDGESSFTRTAFRKGREYSQPQVTPSLHDVKRLEILDEAIMLFSKLGYDAVKVSDITDALHMGKGTFYLYFKNKRELFRSCFKRLDFLIEPLELRDEIRYEKNFFNKARQRWLGFNEKFATFRGILSLLRTACMSDEKDVRENAAIAYTAWIEPFNKDIEQALKQGIIRHVDAELATYLLLGMGESLSFRLSLDSRYSPEDAAELFDSIIRHGLMADETGKGTKETDQGCRVTVTDRDGVSIELHNTLFAGAFYLTGKLGASEIKVDPSRLSTISVSSVDSKWFALLTAKSGQELSLEVDGTTVITGDTLFGGLQIAFERLSLITIWNES